MDQRLSSIAARTRVQKFAGARAQLVAAATHYVSKARLHTLRDSGIYMLVITGDDDLVGIDF